MTKVLSKRIIWIVDGKRRPVRLSMRLSFLANTPPRLQWPDKKAKISTNQMRTSVAQANGLFYDKRTDSYFMKHSIHGEYGPEGQPMYQTGPGSGSAPHHSSPSRVKQEARFGREQREAFPPLSRPKRIEMNDDHRGTSSRKHARMIKPIEPKDRDWHKNTYPKERYSPEHRGMTRTQLRRAQRLYGQKMKAKLSASHNPENALKVPKDQLMPTSQPDGTEAAAYGKNGAPKISLLMLKEKAERLELEKKALEIKLASKTEAKDTLGGDAAHEANAKDKFEVPEVDEDMVEDEEEEDFYSESIQFGTMPNTTDVNMVFTLPKGFKAKPIEISSDTEEIPEEKDDYSYDSFRDYLVPDSDEEGVLSLDITDDADSSKVVNNLPFGKPTKEMATQLKPLYMKAKFDGRPLGRILIDNGAGINIITMKTLRKLGKSKDDIFEPLKNLTNFTGGTEEPIGMLPIEVMIGSKRKLTAFYVIEAAVSYNALLGRDWIHSNRCVPSSLHQSLIFWKGDNIEMVRADELPFEGCVNTAEAKYYSSSEQPIDCRNFYNGSFKRLSAEEDQMAPEASDTNLFE